jgi:hypothetical protein
MPWFRSPVRLFACAALFLFLVRLVFPPADNAAQLHSYLHFFDFRLDLTGYGVFEFAALVFVLCALTYYMVSRLTNGQPNSRLVHLHFWPSLLFAVSSVYLAHRVSRIPAGEVNDPTIQASLHNWLTAFTWAFVAFLLFQIVFAIGAVRCIWQNRNATA